MLRYPIEIIKDTNDTYLVTCPDIPEMASVGDDIESALLEAEQGLEVALSFYFDDRRPIPMPSPIKQGQYAVPLSALQSMKVFLLNEMIAQNVRKAEMARRLDVHLPQIDRLLDFKHATKVDFMEKAFKQLDKELSVSVV
ncbi:type II toxin-antitoxin system HicB family antitoxin [Lonepinella koalarum]|uniref:Antitoxin HicB n=1 Tax=Lonepinella koalarum TaxID=53417 RepID=A0A4R1KV73_9PAST|nr:type II toxin-antitoxin system HicB family antitoxin [Lonepinella koalarum]MDH2927221.1 transcriptional regulator [Lonepinella koalarum]TCK68109.1 antitoxin HicB [Lonepinella koalarum]TFJ89491.1 type II toxin-antitoxin system HicB family antitoxin [Lonepinella koalarum]TYG33473.1 type II toxin-antitoxin system HicB family antitoxin [Lonepinella koalarum]